MRTGILRDCASTPGSQIAYCGAWGPISMATSDAIGVYPPLPASGHRRLLALYGRREQAREAAPVVDKPGLPRDAATAAPHPDA
jgi:hypothetical protein